MTKAEQEKAATQINKVIFKQSLIPYEDLCVKALSGSFNIYYFIYQYIRSCESQVKYIQGAKAIGEQISFYILHCTIERSDGWDLKEIFIFLPGSDKMSAARMENEQLVWMATTCKHMHTCTHTHRNPNNEK